jgi:hypothetical protein
MWLWNREVVIPLSILLYGTGVAAMYSEQYYIAAGLYVSGIAYVTAKILRWEDAKDRALRRVASTIVVAFAAILAALSLK